MNDDDRRLARLLCEGNESAFRDFFDSYFPRLFRFILRRVGGEEESARDIVQASMIKAVRYLPEYRGEASLFTWLCQIGRHELADYYRREKRQAPLMGMVAREEDAMVRATLESTAEESALAPDGIGYREEMIDLVHAALDYLPRRYAQVLELKYLEDLSVEAVAERLGITGIAVQSLLARARSAFREAYDALGPEFDIAKGGKS